MCVCCVCTEVSGFYPLFELLHFRDALNSVLAADCGLKLLASLDTSLKQSSAFWFHINVSTQTELVEEDISSAWVEVQLQVFTAI